MALKGDLTNSQGTVNQWLLIVMVRVYLNTVPMYLQCIWIPTAWKQQQRVCCLLPRPNPGLPRVICLTAVKNLNSGLEGPEMVPSAGSDHLPSGLVLFTLNNSSFPMFQIGTFSVSLEMSRTEFGLFSLEANHSFTDLALCPSCHDPHLNIRI